MRELVSRCPRGPRSGADVGREGLAGEGGAGGDEVGGCALEDDPAAVVAGAGAEVDDPVGVRHDRLVVRDDDARLVFEVVLARAPCTRIKSWLSATFSAGDCVSVLVAVLIESPSVARGRLRGLRRARPAPPT